MSIDVRELLLSTRQLYLVGLKVAEDEKRIYLRVDDSVFEITKDSIVSQKDVTSDEEGPLTGLKLDAGAKIIQSLLIDYERGDRPVFSNIFRRAGGDWGGAGTLFRKRSPTAPIAPDAVTA
jgi:hypothetical protein